MATPRPAKPSPLYDCSKCPAYCCSYDRINVNSADIARIARHFEITPEEAKQRFTKMKEGDRVLRHRKDEIYGTVCMNLDKETRRCTIYEARPGTCREYPEQRRCGYYEFLSWERKHQDNPEFIPLQK
ncbi:MAG TPA: YkgJ family cysteine cluster protein [Thermoanaerobaculia bacterium]|nr:YkgJ family cysteine cluster protein [Thermoanaerobaculia bacterium]